MAIKRVEFQLPKDRTFIRFSNESLVDDVRIVKITPHNEVYDGMEIAVLVEVPDNTGVSISLSVGQSYGSNLSLPALTLQDVNFITRDTEDASAHFHEYTDMAPDIVTGETYKYDPVANADLTPQNHLFCRKLYKFIWDANNSWWIASSLSILTS